MQLQPDDRLPGLNRYIPKPGSPEAVAQGCTCPIYDNNRGVGTAEGGWDVLYLLSPATFEGSASLIVRLPARRSFSWSR